MVYKGDLNDFMLLLASDSARLGGILGQVTRSLGAARDARLFTSRESEKKSAKKSIILQLPKNCAERVYSIKSFFTCSEL